MRGGGVLTLLSIFLLCLSVGLIAGNHIKRNIGDANASSANITVTNNNQIVTEDQGTGLITKTSTVTVRDTTATLGYTLSAKINNNSIPSSTITIHSPTSTTCTQSSPCTLTTNPTPTTILETNTAAATTQNGHTTNWTVTITMPGSTPQGNYLLDIAYSEDPILPQPLVDGTNLQDATVEQCEITPLGTTVNLKDTRDNKYYRVRKMADFRCWMIDNLAYQLLQNDTGSTPNTGAPTYSPTAQVDTTPSGTPNLTLAKNVAQYAINTSAYNIPNNGNPTPSYLYNWCAAMGDTSTSCATTLAYTVAGQPATPQTGICPAPFRLPIVGDIPGPTTPNNHTTTTNEFAKLDIRMGGTGTYRTYANTYNNWMGMGTPVSLQNNWSGTNSGNYGNSGLVSQGAVGYWWSSTAYGNNNYALGLQYSSTAVYPTLAAAREDGLAIRCIL